MKKNTLLIVGVLGIGGVIAYEWWKKNQAAAAPTTNSGTGSDFLLPATQTTSPATGIPSTPNNSAASTNTIDPGVQSTVVAWANADGRTPVLHMAQAMVPLEYAGMYDIITNFWNKGVTVVTPSTQQQFWDDLRKKYDPTHTQW